MAKPIKTWFVITDGAAARILTRRDDGPGFAVVAERHSDEARRPTRELVSDRPGRGKESATTTRHAIEPREDWHRLRKQQFARELAQEVNRAGGEGRYEALVLVAPARTLGELRRALAAPARAKVTGELAKDLTKVPPDRLDAHLGDFQRFHLPS